MKKTIKETLSTYLRGLFIYLLWLFLIWAATAFIQLEANPFLWGDLARVSYVIFGIMIGAAMAKISQAHFNE